MSKSFSAIIGKWAAQTEDRIEAVRNRSIEMLSEEMINTKPNGGNMPFLTGNLSRSLLADTKGMPKIAPGPFAGDNVGLVTATLRADQPVWLGFQANYARRMNYGFVGADALGRVYNQQGNHFVEGAIAEWPNIVKKAVNEIKQNGS